MTTNNDSKIGQTEQEFSFKQSIKSCLLPILMVSAGLYLLVQLYILIGSNQNEIGQFFTVKYDNLGYLLFAVYFDILAAIYVTCCAVKYEGSFSVKTLVLFYMGVIILYVCLILIMTHSFDSTAAFSQTEDILHSLALIPAWILVIGLFLGLIALFA